MKRSICPLCMVVSGAWLILSAGVVWGFLTPSAWLLPIALLMGGSVVGISNKIALLRWKVAVIIVGMPLAYLAVTNLNKTTVIIEFIAMLFIAFLLFTSSDDENSKSSDDRAKKLEEHMKQCC